MTGRRLSTILGLLLIAATVVYSQGPWTVPPSTNGEVRITATTSDALGVGCAQVSPSTSQCTGGIFAGPITGGWTYVTTTATGSQDDFNPGIVGHTVIRANNASALTITGFAPAAAAVNGQMVLVQAINSTVAFDHTPSASAAENELINIATSANTPLNTRGYALYVYDATTAMWRLAAHEQGGWITPTFDAGNFTAASGNWTVDSTPDYVTYAYRLDGRTLSVQFSIGATDVSATPAHLLMAVPGGFTLTKEGGASIMVGNATTVLSAGMADWLAGATTFRFFISPNSTTWSTTASDNTYVRGSMTVEVN